jgi:4-hydroxy-tetrahydrodipicolinate synthase
MFFGSIPALVTPFAAGRVNEAAFRELVDWQVEEGSNALVPCGTTGEAATLTTEEHRCLIEITVEVARGRVPVIAGCGSNNTSMRSSLPNPRRPPAPMQPAFRPYNRPNQDGIYAHRPPLPGWISRSSFTMYQKDHHRYRWKPWRSCQASQCHQ